VKLALGSLVALVTVVANVRAPDATTTPARAVDFVHEVLPTLQRAGCSSAYCHGSATGRAGFKLSLFGSDAEADYSAITAQLGGRRLDLQDPPASLLVQKALGRLDHGGGRRLARDGFAHGLLLEWIAGGAPWRGTVAAQLTGLTLSVDDERMRAVATYEGENGPEQRDVSDLALFSSTNPNVVEIDVEGVVRERGAGLAYGIARYGNQTARVRIVRAFPAAGHGADSLALSSHALDVVWGRHLRELGLAPAPRVGCERLARRLYLDLIGRPPTPQELREFTAAPDVAAVASRLTLRPEFAEVWGERLARWLEVPTNGPDAARLRAACVAAVHNGGRVTSIANDVIDGRLGAVDRLPDARDRGEYVARTLLGVRIGCARCHDHPLDHWRRREHLAWSACFAQRRPDGMGGTTDGVLFDPDRGDAVTPELPAFGSLPARIVGEDRRGALREFVGAREHDQLARNFANRTFAELLGRGLVEPPDDHRVGNPACAPELLETLVAELHGQEDRLAALVVFVTTSALYAADVSAESGPAVDLFAARASLPLRPEAYVRALTAIVGGAPVQALPGSPLARELALQNGTALPDLLARGGSTIDAIFDLGGSGPERLDELWLTVLSRSPRQEEIERFLPFASGDLASFRDLAQALFTGREFGHRR
jgi:hypothetical protein